MNAAVRAVVRVAAHKGVHVVGFEDGYEGLVDGRVRELTRQGPSGPCPIDAVDDALPRGGTILGTARSARFMTVEGRAAAARNLDGMLGLVVLGGDGSMRGLHLLASEHPGRFQVMGVPASIDNDIGCTAMALGVDTALNTIVEACDRLSDTAGSHRRAFVVEVMGRRSGYLAMASAVACGADAVLVPEEGRSEESIVEAVAKLVREGFSPARGKRRMLVVKAEGVEIPCTRLVRRVEERLADVEPRVDLRAAVLGHLVRGGAPSYFDRMVGARLALSAVDAILAGATDEMCAWMPTVQGGVETRDPSVRRFSLERVLEETAALLDPSSTVTRWRLGLLRRVEGALAI